MSIISSGVGRGRGTAAGDRGDMCPGDWLEACLWKGLRVCIREMGEAMGE